MVRKELQRHCRFFFFSIISRSFLHRLLNCFQFLFAVAYIFGSDGSGIGRRMASELLLLLQVRGVRRVMQDVSQPQVMKVFKTSVSPFPRKK